MYGGGAAFCADTQKRALGSMPSNLHLTSPGARPRHWPVDEPVTRFDTASEPIMQPTSAHDAYIPPTPGKVAGHAS